MPGVPVIPIVSNAVFSKTDINPGVGNQVIAISTLVGALIGPFTSLVATIRNILLWGYLSSSILLFIITILFATNNDNAAFYFLIVLMVIY